MGRSKSRSQASRPPTVTQSEDPWLVYYHGKSNGGGRSQTFYSLSDGCSYQKTIPEMSSCYIQTCSHGWLVMLGRDDADLNCFLLNPVTMDKINLPSWRDFSFSTCILTSSPVKNNTDCFVVLLSSQGRSAMFCQPGDKEWTVQESPLDDCEDYVKQAVACGGKIYGLTGSRVNAEKRGNLIRIDVEANSSHSNPRLTFMQLRATREIYISPHSEYQCHDKHLIESCGEIFIVQVKQIAAPISGSLQDIDDNNKYIIQTVEVFKLDLAEMVWEKVNSLGDNLAFLIGDSYNLSCPASSATRPSRIKANCIYFSCNNERKLYQFNIREKSMVEYVPCPNVVNNISQTDWIVPHM